MTTFDRESLLNLHLVRWMYETPHVAKRPRAIDCRWTYEKLIPVSLGGFNPFSSSIYFGAESMFARWLPHAAASARDFNDSDLLIPEVFLAVHDCLHVWAYALLNELLGTRRLGHGPIDDNSVETLVFLHLVTEAVATVGVDYWYLSTLELNDVVPVGTSFRTLTVSYHNADLDEFRRFDPNLAVQEPGFLRKIVQLYCDGRYDGFDVTDLRRSPKILRWLRKELAYGACQRRYIRQWLDLLAPVPRDRGPGSLDGPVEFEDRWQVELVEQVSTRLWALVHDSRGELPWPAPPAPDANMTPWTSVSSPRDFRFVNLNALAHDVIHDPTSSAESFRFFVYQYLSRLQLESVDREVVRIVPEIIRLRDERLLRGLFRGVPEIAAALVEPYDLMFLN